MDFLVDFPVGSLVDFLMDFLMRPIVVFLLDFLPEFLMDFLMDFLAYLFYYYLWLFYGFVCGERVLLELGPSEASNSVQHAPCCLSKDAIEKCDRWNTQQCSGSIRPPWLPCEPETVKTQTELLKCLPFSDSCLEYVGLHYPLGLRNQRCWPSMHSEAMLAVQKAAVFQIPDGAALCQGELLVPRMPVHALRGVDAEAWLCSGWCRDPHSEAS